MERKYTSVVGRVDGIFKDEIGFVEEWDFSRGNISEEARIEVITSVASICYANPNAVGKENLYNRLKAESIGLPSSSFEFVPILLDQERIGIIIDAIFEKNESIQVSNVERYGEYITEDLLLTNYRALLYDYENLKDFLPEDITKWFNKEDEAKIIKKYFKTFLCKIDMNTSKQFIRHRNANYQELSRRYVSGKKQEFEFYVSPEIKGTELESKVIQAQVDSVVLYKELSKSKIKAEDARRVIPQSMYTTIWSGWQPRGIKNFFDLRLDLHAQQEIRWLAEGMDQLIK